VLRVQGSTLRDLTMLSTRRRQSPPAPDRPAQSVRGPQHRLAVLPGGIAADATYRRSADGSGDERGRSGDGLSRAVVAAR
jgi:hypothetical protein